jgi:hypothetical protein
LNVFPCQLGLIWPIEAQPYLMKMMTFYFPASRSIAAFREILLRKTDILSPIVTEAYAVCAVWILLSIILAIILIKFKK